MIKDSLKPLMVPTIPRTWPVASRETPISPRDNFMRALCHKKPRWMPNLITDAQTSPMDAYGDDAPSKTEDGTDWFGIEYRYSASQGTNTPLGGLLSKVSAWRDEIQWPDLDAWDWARGADGFQRDENKALYLPFAYGLFEKFHSMEGFEQALIDLITEPETCRAFFDRLADHKIEVFRRLNEIYRYDFVLYYDDWGAQRAPFFSADLFEQTLLKPSKKIVRAIQSEGVQVVFHNSGLVDAFVPYLIRDIGADGLQIQVINDIDSILKQYGGFVTVNYRPAPDIMYDPAMTVERMRLFAREIVEQYGAHNNDGAGVFVSSYALTEEIYCAFVDEIYEYSLIKYDRL